MVPLFTMDRRAKFSKKNDLEGSAKGSDLVRVFHCIVVTMSDLHTMATRVPVLLALVEGRRSSDTRRES